MRGFNRFHGLFRFLVLHIGIAAMNHRASTRRSPIVIPVWYQGVKQKE